MEVYMGKIREQQGGVVRSFQFIPCLNPERGTRPLRLNYTGKYTPETCIKHTRREMEFRTIEKSDYDHAIEHLRLNFFADEPLNKAVKLCSPGEGHEELEKQCIETMNDGLSIMAYEDDIILGVALNGITRPGDATKALKKLETIDDEKFKKIFRLLYGMTEELDLFGMYTVDSMLECRIVSVDSRARGKGVAGQLIQRSIQIARDNGFQVFKGDATGAFSQRICEKNGLQTLKEVYYKDYLDPETGLPVFEVLPPHNSLKIMTLIL